jgi:winged helix domain-containing protein/ATPase family protein associated with various cellular activities (AAA)
MSHAGTGPYRSSDEHLRDELRRIDQLVRARTVRWRSTLAATKPASLWGMIHVTDQEVEDYLRAPFAAPQEVPAALEPVRRAADLAKAIARRRAETPPEVSLRLAFLVERCGLSDLERDILLVCLLPELDSRYRRLFGYLQDDASRTRPTVELVLEILQPEAPDPGAARDVFARGGALVGRALLASGPELQGEEPLPLRSLRLDDRIAGFLLGSDRLDGRLDGIVHPAAESPGWDDLPIEPAQVERLRKLAEGWRGERGPRAVLLHGPYGSGRLAAARALSADLGTPLLVAAAGRALQSSEAWERIVGLAFREAVLRGAALAWTGCETLLAADAPPWRWDRLTEAAEAFDGLTLLISETAWEPAGRFRESPFLRFDVPVPGYRHRRCLWERLLPDLGREVAETLANGFQLTAGQMADALATARSLAELRAPHAPRPTAEDLHEGCRRQSVRRLATFARRIEPRTELTFDDLVLPPASRQQLDELRGRIAHHGRVQSELGFERRLSLGKGLLALFTGSSGTGKTMAAELLARERGVDLYKVDLSAVVSKWVGETEKNLNRLFAEAEDANSILFFDEADALFGKRGEVKDARDRWANLEIDYLLQRVEEYAGVVILASNLRQNIDEAFLRRIQMLVDFPFPDAGVRLRILRGLFPEGVDRPDEDGLRQVADRFQLPGGSLKNIVLDATFRALAEESGEAGERPAITLRHLVLGTAREYQKLGRPITRTEFGDELYGCLDETTL